MAPCEGGRGAERISVTAGRGRVSDGVDVAGDSERMDRRGQLDGIPPAKTPRIWMSMRDVERAHILRTLEETSFNQSAAARLLRIDRNLLLRKIKRYAIDVSQSKRGRPSN